MQKSNKSTKTLYLGIFIAAIVAMAFSVASVFAEDVPKFDVGDDVFSCTNGETLSCSDNRCIGVCSSGWQACGASNDGDTLISGKYICDMAHWADCNASTVNNISTSGSTCNGTAWVVSPPGGLGLPLNCGNGTPNEGEKCDFGTVNNNGTTKSNAINPFSAFIAPVYGEISKTYYTCSAACASGSGVELGTAWCGDSFVQTSQGELCDDFDGTACNATCTACTAGYTLIGDTCVEVTLTPTCGNGLKEGTETCDDGDASPCKEDCMGCKTGFSLQGGKCTKDAATPAADTQCDDGKDNDNDGKKDYPSDPGCSSKSDNSETDTPQGAIKILDVDVFPIGFNPSMAKTDISYKLSATGIVELTILNEAGVEVVKLIDNEEIDGNQLYTTSWDGTDDPEGDGEIVEPGKYFFKITVKAAESSSISDTKTGEVNVIYTLDFEGVGASNVSGNAGIVSAMHNAPPKETSGTGPETVIYLLLPILGYFGSKIYFSKASKK